MFPDLPMKKVLAMHQSGFGASASSNRGGAVYSSASRASKRDSGDVPRVMAFIHSCLSRLRFSLRKDVIDHHNILLLSFFNRGECHFLMNVYLDDRYSTVKFMLDQIIDIPNLLYMGRDFSIRDAEWDPSISSYPVAG